MEVESTLFSKCKPRTLDKHLGTWVYSIHEVDETLKEVFFFADERSLRELQVWAIGMTAWAMAPGKVLEHLQPWIPGAFRKRSKQATTRCQGGVIFGRRRK